MPHHSLSMLLVCCVVFGLSEWEAMGEDKTRFSESQLEHFEKHIESGLDVSELFPHIGGCADDLTVIRSMIAPFSEHTNGNYFLHTCVGVQGRPSHGAWVVYGLGSECQNLPGYGLHCA